MSDIRFNQWLHQSGTGGVSQDHIGNIGIGTTNPSIVVSAANTAVLNVGVITANNLFVNNAFNGDITGNVTGNISGATGTFSGNVDIADKIIHTGDTDTAMRFPADNTFAVDTAGSERLRITSTGKVGIGTDNPEGSKVQIDTTSGGRAVTLNAPTLGTYLTFETAGTAFADIGSEAGLTGSGSNTEMLTLNARGSRDLAFRTNSNERLRITSGGLVRVTDSASLTFGNNDDMRIFHDGGSANYIDVYNKDLYIRCNRDSGITGGDIILQPKSGENSAIFRDDGNVELYHDNTKRFETMSTGVKITNNLYIGGSTNGGFSYNAIADTLEFLTTNGGTHSELNSGAYVPGTNGGKHLGNHNKRWNYLFCNGIRFGGENSDAHTLDDYEEGSSTVSIQNMTADTNQVVMKYTKIGSVVCVVGVITLVNITASSGANAWFHLPFAPSHHSTAVPGASIQKNSINTGVKYLGFYGANTNMYFMSQSGGYTSGNQLSAGQIGFTATYTTH